MKCRQCGNIISPGAKYCAYCGASLFVSQDASIFPRVPVWVMLLTVLIIIGAAAGVPAVLFWPSDTANPSTPSSHSETSRSTPSSHSTAGWTIIRTNNAGNIEYYAEEVDGSTTRIIVGTPLGEESTPIYLTDGSRIFGKTSPEYNYGGPHKEYYITSADGQSQRMISKHTGFVCQGLALSPDGNKIAYTYAMLQEGAIRIVNTNGETIRDLRFWFQGRPTAPSWSPTGDHIAFCGQRGQGSVYDAGIYVVNINTGTKTKLATFGNNPSWSADSNKIVFTNGNQVYAVRISDGKISQVGNL